MNVVSTRRSHALWGATVMALLACVALAAAGAARAATYPDSDGSSFNSDAEGWTSALAECTAAGPPACSQENLYEPAGGNQSGGIVARTTVLVNGLELFRGDSHWRSPSFVVQPDVGASTLTYDRRFDTGGLVALAPRAVVEAVLVDETGGTPVSLGSEELTESDSGFAARQVAVASGSLVAGRTYHLELRSTTSTTAARVGVLGSAEIQYDNVALRPSDGSGGSGGSGDGGGSGGSGGASGSPGVTFPGAAIDSRAFRLLDERISLYAEAGTGPGGSLVALSRCTIVGTPGNDRIRGSRRNDVICALGGNDVVVGGRGRDLIDGGNGNDRLNGAAGGDLLLGLRGRDRIAGGAGKDRAGAGAGADRLRGRGGNDKLVGASGADRLGGDAGADRLDGGRGKDRLAGGKGRDRMFGGAGRDRLSARDRNRDRVRGGGGRDRATVDSGRRGLRKLDLVGGVERSR